MKVIEIKDVHKIYDGSEVEVHAVNGVNLTFEEGEFAAIVGPSGSGKTTLLNLIGGLDHPSSGALIVGGTDLSTLKPSALIDFRMKNIGFVFQSYNLIPVLTAKENIEFIMVLQKRARQERDNRTLELLKAIGLAGSEGNTLLARKMPPVPVDGGPETVDLGFVGEVEGVDPMMIDTLCSLGFVPVVYSICGDAEGRLMNVNADTAAAALAAGIKATDMVLVTEVPGVLRVFEDMSSTIPEIREADLGPLTSSGILKDGMIPKVEACFLALRGGVGTAHIICGTTPDAIVEQLFSGRNLGTRLTL